MVEEMMLLANETVGHKILETFPYTACLRRHPKPTESKFVPLLTALETKDLSLDLTSNKARYLSRSSIPTYCSQTLSMSLDRAVLPGNPYFNVLVRMMCTRCMPEVEMFDAICRSTVIGDCLGRVFRIWRTQRPRFLSLWPVYGCLHTFHISDSALS